MVAEIMPALDKLLHAVRVVIHPAAGHEKCDLYIVLIQDFHDLREILRPPRRNALIVRIAILELPEI
jgi:hypothetical protein